MSGRSPMRILIELVPQSMAATVSVTVAGFGCHARSGRPPLAERLEHLVAQRVDPGPGDQAVRGQDMQALHAVRHATGRDAVDLLDALPFQLGQLGAVTEVG